MKRYIILTLLPFLFVACNFNLNNLQGSFAPDSLGSVTGDSLRIPNGTISQGSTTATIPLKLQSTRFVTSFDIQIQTSNVDSIDSVEFGSTILDLGDPCKNETALTRWCGTLPNSETQTNNSIFSYNNNILQLSADGGSADFGNEADLVNITFTTVDSSQDVTFTVKRITGAAHYPYFSFSDNTDTTASFIQQSETATITIQTTPLPTSTGYQIKFAVGDSSATASSKDTDYKTIGELGEDNEPNIDTDQIFAKVFANGESALDPQPTSFLWTKIDSNNNPISTYEQATNTFTLLPGFTIDDTFQVSTTVGSNSVNISAPITIQNRPPETTTVTNNTLATKLSTLATSNNAITYTATDPDPDTTRLTVDEDTAITLNLANIFTDPDTGQTLTYYIGDNDEGTINQETGVYEWTPSNADANDDTKTYTITLTARDSYNPPATSPTQAFDIEVTPVNDPPTFVGPIVYDDDTDVATNPHPAVINTAGGISLNLVEGKTISINAAATDIDSQNLTYSLVTSSAGTKGAATNIDYPQDLSLNKKTGNITWTISDTYLADNGAFHSPSFKLYVKASDDDLFDILTITVTITETAVAPVIKAPTITDTNKEDGSNKNPFTADEDTDIMLDLKTWKDDPDTDLSKLTWSIVEDLTQKTYKGAISAADIGKDKDKDKDSNKLTITPNKDFNNPADTNLATQTLTLKLTDDTDKSTTHQLHFRWNAVNDAPTLKTEIKNITIQEDSGFAADDDIDISDNFEDVDKDPLTFTATQGKNNDPLPDWLKLKTDTGKFSIDTDETNNYNGTISITVTANDGISTTNATDTFDLTVTAVDDDPVITRYPGNTNSQFPDDNYLYNNVAWKYRLEFEDADGDNITARLGSGAPAGLTLPKEGDFYYLAWTPSITANSKISEQTFTIEYYTDTQTKHDQDIKLQVIIQDQEGPHITDIQATSNNTLAIIFDEPIKSSSEVAAASNYTIKASNDSEIKVQSIAIRNNQITITTIGDDPISEGTYTLDINATVSDEHNGDDYTRDLSTTTYTFSGYESSDTKDTTTTVTPGSLGDVYQDPDRPGKINNQDALAILKHVAGVSLLTDKITIADVNCSKEIDPLDAVEILKKRLGITPNKIDTPCEQ